MTITGANTLSVALRLVSLGPGITVNSITINNPTSLVVNITIARRCRHRFPTLTVTTGAQIVTLDGGFNVTDEAVRLVLSRAARAQVFRRYSGRKASLNLSATSSSCVPAATRAKRAQ